MKKKDIIKSAINEYNELLYMDSKKLSGMNQRQILDYILERAIPDAFEILEDKTVVKKTLEKVLTFERESGGRKRGHISVKKVKEWINRL